MGRLISLAWTGNPRRCPESVQIAIKEKAKIQFITLYRAIGSSPQKTICSKIYTPKGKFGFPKKKNIKTGTKSKVLRPVDKTTVMSSKSRSYRYLVLVKFVLFNINYTYCDENHMVEEMCISHQ